MCKLVFGIQFKESPLIRKIIKSQIKDLNVEKDGCAGMVMNTKNEVSIEKRLVTYSDVYDFIIDSMSDAKLFGIHTRTKTTGSKSIENCHFYEYKNRVFAHNGIISEYSSYNKKNSTLFGKDNESTYEDGYWLNGEYYDKTGKLLPEGKIESSKEIVKVDKVENDDTDKTDSRLFLENLPKELTRKNLHQYCNDKGFSGVAVIIEKDKKKAWILSGRDIDVHTDCESYIMFYSYSPEDKIKNHINFMGFPLIDSNDDVELKKYTLEKNIYEINYSSIRA